MEYVGQFFIKKKRTSSNQTGKMLPRRLPGSGLVYIKVKYSKFMANPPFAVLYPTTNTIGRPLLVYLKKRYVHKRRITRRWNDNTILPKASLPTLLRQIAKQYFQITKHAMFLKPLVVKDLIVRGPCATMSICE
jgi:hypothetical protein